MSQGIEGHRGRRKRRLASRRRRRSAVADGARRSSSRPPPSRRRPSRRRPAARDAASERRGVASPRSTGPWAKRLSSPSGRPASTPTWRARRLAGQGATFADRRLEQRRRPALVARHLQHRVLQGRATASCRTTRGAGATSRWSSWEAGHQRARGGPGQRLRVLHQRTAHAMPSTARRTYGSTGSRRRSSEMKTHLDARPAGDGPAGSLAIGAAPVLPLRRSSTMALRNRRTVGRHSFLSAVWEQSARRAAFVAVSCGATWPFLRACTRGTKRRSRANGRKARKGSGMSNVIVVGCGRVGSQLANMLSDNGSNVCVIDRSRPTRSPTWGATSTAPRCRAWASTRTRSCKAGVDECDVHGRRHAVRQRQPHVRRGGQPPATACPTSSPACTTRTTSAPTCSWASTTCAGTSLVAEDVFSKVVSGHGAHIDTFGEFEVLRFSLDL